MSLKRGRNIAGLLANLNEEKQRGRKYDPTILQERGVHGALTSDNKVRYGTKDQEGRNFLKAVDRYHNRDDWNKDLGGGQNYMQGPTGDSSDYVDPLMRMGDAETIDDHLTDLASNRAAEMQTRIDKIDPSGPAIYKQKYSYSDELGPDSEALEEAAMDEASEMQAMSDAYPQFEGDERLAQREARLKKGQAAAMADFKGEEEGSTWDTVKAYAGRAGDAISGLFDSDDEEGKKAFGKALTNKAMGVGDPKSGGGGARMDSAKTVAGKVAFPGLLQQQPKRQRTPYFMPKGLV